MRAYMQSLLESLYKTYKPLTEGTLPTYIPQLSAVDPDLFAISLVTTEGDVYEVGDTQYEFTIQSISKPFLYGLVLQECGRELVRSRIGVEPTGDPYNAIKLHPLSNRPYNPMVNAGAIALAEMVPGQTPQECTLYIQKVLEAFADSPLGFDQQVYQSETFHGNHNRAMAYLMLNFGMLKGPVEETLEVYFRACSFLVKTRALAHMAAVLANGGAHLKSQLSLLRKTYTKDLLSIMFTCGMYDFAGEWAYTLGFPAKSGVSGGILGVVPQKLGVAVFSPRLDQHGNSVRGIRVLQDLSRLLNLSIF